MTKPYNADKAAAHQILADAHNAALEIHAKYSGVPDTTGPQHLKDYEALTQKHPPGHINNAEKSAHENLVDSEIGSKPKAFKDMTAQEHEIMALSHHQLAQDWHDEGDVVSAALHNNLSNLHAQASTHLSAAAHTPPSSSVASVAAPPAPIVVKVDPKNPAGHPPALLNKLKSITKNAIDDSDIYPINVIDTASKAADVAAKNYHASADGNQDIHHLSHQSHVALAKAHMDLAAANGSSPQAQDHWLRQHQRNASPLSYGTVLADSIR